MKNTLKLIDFIRKCPDAYHAVRTVSGILRENGFAEIFEKDEWHLQRGGKYFVTRNSSSIAAFALPETDYSAFLITASHTDSPCFKLKSNFELEAANTLTASVEAYGGMIMSSWLDRPLSVSGRVIVNDNGALAARLVNIDRDLLIIPSLAVHLNRDINKGYEYNVKTDMCPILGENKGSLLELIAENAGVKAEEIAGFDLSLYSRGAAVLGTDNEYFSAPRIDDLQCVFAALEGFVSAPPSKNVQVFAAFDNEEVGSSSKQGAKSTFLADTLERINAGLDGGFEKYKTALAKSFMLSCDNAHAVHPNHADKSDSLNRVYLNGGIVIKYNANAHYTTDAVSEAAVKILCEKAGVPYQLYANRSDMAGGSTLGNLSAQQVSVITADIGLAQLAMHSACETAGTKDTSYMIKLIKTFYESNFEF